MIFYNGDCIEDECLATYLHEDSDSGIPIKIIYTANGFVVGKPGCNHTRGNCYFMR